MPLVAAPLRPNRHPHNWSGHLDQPGERPLGRPAVPRDETSGTSMRRTTETAPLTLRTAAPPTT